MTRRNYHLPSDVDIRGDLPADTRSVVTAALVRAVAQAVGNAAPGDVAMAVAARPVAREMWSRARERDSDDTYSVPSYDNQGEPTGIPQNRPARASGAPLGSPNRDEIDLEQAKIDLFGLEHLFDRYKAWRSRRTRLEAQLAPAKVDFNVHAYGPAEPRGVAADFQAALAENAIMTSDEFEALLRRFLTAFEREAVKAGLELLHQYEQFLNEEFARWGQPGASAGFAEVGPGAAVLYERAEHDERAAPFHDVSLTGPLPLHQRLKPGERPAPHKTIGDQLREQAKAMRTAADILINNVARSKVVAAEDFDRAALARAAWNDVPGLIRDYIAEHRKSVAETRGHLVNDHAFVYQLPDLIEVAAKRLGLADGSIYRRIIEDRIARYHMQNAVKQIALAVLTLAIAFATAGTGLVAVLGAAAVAGLGTYQAIDAYAEYSRMHAAYQARMIAADPSIAWVIVAAIGALIDLGAVGGTLARLDAALTKDVREAIRTFNTSKAPNKVETLTKALVEQGVPEDIVAAIVPAARVEARQGASVAARTVDALTAFDAGAPEGLAKMVRLVWVADRRGVTTLDRFVAQLQADRLIAEGELSAGEAAVLRDAFGQARAAVVRLNEAARAAYLTDSRLADLLDAWVQTPGRTLAEVEQLVLTNGSPSIARLEAMSLDEVRQLAKQHPDAVAELEARYRRMSSEELDAQVRQSSDGLARRVREERELAQKAGKRAEKQVKELEKYSKDRHWLRHEATAKVVGRDGGLRPIGRGEQARPIARYTSETEIPEAEALPTSQWREANWYKHTERQAVLEAELRPGETLQIGGTFDPCSRCMGFMREMSRGGRRIVYEWQGGKFIAYDGVVVQPE
ncbi:hypothetical protein [Dactylosporangium sp. CA-092794]|uniref:hypothetical protein n=1 Tax=Dactylosporangium sp. CA-092794 TaxID=3239929 RepID=UPI003D8D7190